MCLCEAEKKDSKNMAAAKELATDDVKNNQDPKFWKVPGELVPMGKMKYEIETLRNQMRNKKTVELEEMLARQQKLVNNTRLLTTLPDKGEKARNKVSWLQALLEERRGETALTTAMAGLRLPDTEAMEWGRGGGRIGPSDEQESDAALRLLAEKEVGSAPDKDEVDLHGARRVSYLDHFKPEHHFAPFTTAKMAENGDIMDKYPVPSSFAAHKRAVRPKPEHQTPSIPLPTHYTCQTKSLTLQESLVIQQEGADRLREATVRQAASRLAAHHAHEKAAFQAHKTAAAEAEEPALTTADAAKIVDTRWRDTQLDSDDDEAVEVHDDSGGEESGCKINVATFENCDDN